MQSPLIFLWFFIQFIFLGEHAVTDRRSCARPSSAFIAKFNLTLLQNNHNNTGMRGCHFMGLQKPKTLIRTSVFN